MCTTHKISRLIFINRKSYQDHTRIRISISKNILSIAIVHRNLNRAATKRRKREKLFNCGRQNIYNSQDWTSVERCISTRKHILFAVDPKNGIFVFFFSFLLLVYWLVCCALYSRRHWFCEYYVPVTHTHTQHKIFKQSWWWCKMWTVEHSNNNNSDDNDDDELKNFMKK